MLHCRFRDALPMVLPGYDQRCHCPAGFRKKYCDADINECYQQPCKNGGNHLHCLFMFNSSLKINKKMGKDMVNMYKIKR